MSGRKMKKNGRLCQRAHGDCFLHVTASWLNYWPISHTSENLMLVRVCLPDGHQFLTCLSPKPLPPKSVRRVSARDIEIDTDFAKQLGIYTYVIEVLVEAVGDIERCIELCLEPINPDDLDKLELNHGKIEFELLNRIRVVSAQSFCFPIWIGSEVIPVRVVSSVPAATWVLLGSELTGTTRERATAVTFKRSSQTSPCNSSSTSSSYVSPIEPTSDGYNTFSWSQRTSLHCGTGSGSEDSASELDGENTSIVSSAGSKLFELVRTFINPAINSQGVVGIQAEGGVERTGTRTPEPSGASAPPTVTSRNKLQPSHRKSKSLSQLSSPTTSSSIKLPKYIETPEMNALLRVQPHSIGGPHEISTGGNSSGGGDPVWDYTRVFDVYVHPSSLPEISNYYYSSQELGSFLVQVKSANSSHKSVPHSQSGQNDAEAAILSPPIGTQSSETSSVADGDTVTSPVSKSGLEISRLMSVVAGLSQSFNDTQSSDTASDTSSTKSEKTQNFSLPKSLVLRLCFATKLVSRSDGRIFPLLDPIPPPTPLIAVTDYREVLKIIPGHIVMSQIVRQQLKISACSLLRVSHVREEGRVPTSHNHVTLHLRPLDHRESIMSMHRQRLEEAIKIWVQEVYQNNLFGAVLVTNQIIPIPDAAGGFKLCSLEVVANSNLKLSSSINRSSQQLVYYLMLTPQEVFSTLNHSGRVRIMVDKTQWSPANVRLTSLAELDPVPVALNPRHFGAFDKLIERGQVYLDSSLLRSSHMCGGRLLISGGTGDAGLKCGKTSLAQLIVQRFTDNPIYAHVQMINCTSFRAQTAFRVGRRLREIFDLAVHCQPSVVVLDNLHNAMPHLSDVEDQTSGEAMVATRNAQALLDQLNNLNRTSSRVVVIATTKCKEDLHPMLLQSRGCHVFSEILEIPPPELAGRISILNAVMEARSVYLDSDIRHIAMRTEGYQVGDLTSVVDRAISMSHIRHTCPTALGNTHGTPVPKRRSQVSFTFDDIDILTGGGNGGVVSPLTSRSLPSSPLKERRRLKITKSLSPTLKLASKDNINTSTQTLVEKDRASNQLEMDADEKTRLSSRDFRLALSGFVPMTLRGLALHSVGSVDFSHVGGMNETKKILCETILWPSMYPKMFSQCPIRMCRGVLLYGPPGTGKTLLAGSIAKEFGLNFVSVKGPEILSKYIGASEQAVRDLFARAQAAKPCVLFFDEFDSLAPKRGQDRTGVTDRVVNQLLTQLDGVESLEGVYTVAATSRPDMIDPALLRPGRIDKSILCNHPNEEERLEILKTLSRGMNLQSTVDLKQIAHRTTYCTGADLKAVLYSAQLRAAHRVLDREEKNKQKLDSDHVASPLSSPIKTMDINTVVSHSTASTTWTTYTTTTATVKTYRLTRTATKCTELQPHRDIQQRAVILSKLSRDGVSKDTLTQNIHYRRGEIDSDRERRTQELCVTQEDMTVALKDVKPSVSLEDRQRFTDIYARFTGKIPQTLKAVVDQRATMA